MSVPAAIVLGAGLGVFVCVPVIGVGAVLLADVICNWHQKRIARG